MSRVIKDLNDFLLDIPQKDNVMIGVIWTKVRI